jgi:hypothetical protein
MAPKEARELSKREVLGMIVRMASVRVEPERIDEIVGRYRETVRPIHQSFEGLRNHYFLIDNLSCLLKALNREGQKEADDLQLKALRRNRMDLPRK